MFFADRQQSIHEMWRVLQSGGRLAAAIWDSLDNTRGQAAIAQILRRLFGAEVA
jgi:ubiquinone/menaquinone biosynthesis C-methylase UbiE